MYTYQEFPRVVYGPEGETLVIEHEDQRPDGWRNHPDDFLSAAVVAKEKADADAKAAEKALREGYKSFLDRHHVDYAKNLGTDKLADLVAQLEAHIAAQDGASDDDGN